MQNDTYELLNSLSDEDIMRIQNRDFAPLEKIKNKKTGNNQQPQQQMEPSQRPMNQNQGMLPEESQNPYKKNSIGRNLASGLASGAYENVRGIADLIGLKPKPRQFWGDPESNSFGAGKFLGEWGLPFGAALKAGKAIGKAAPGLRQAASWLPEALGVGAVGAAVHPGTINERLATGAGEGALVPAFHGIIKGLKAAKQGISNAKSNINYARPEKFQKEINETIQDIFKGKKITPERENKLVYGEINKKANLNKAKSSEMYDKVKEEAVNNGYDGFKKKIRITPDEFIKDKRLMRSLRSDSEVSRRFTEFLNEPSFKNAHELQSILNEQSFKLNSPLNDMASKNLAKTFKDTRKRILNAIESTLKENGDVKLLTGYKDATKNYAENVVPYIKSKAMRDISNSSLEKGSYIFSENPITLLTKNNSRTQKVVSDLPDKSKRFLLQKMLEDAKTGDHFDPVKLKKIISDIKSSRKVNLTPQEELMKLEDLLNKGKKLEKTREFVKEHKGKLIVGGIGVPGLIGGGKVLKELFSDKKD
jgi:hypothetical protein